MIGGFFASGEALERRAVHQENIGPAVVVVIKDCHSGAGRLDDVLLRVHSAEHVLHVESGLLRNIGEVGNRTGRSTLGSRCPREGNRTEKRSRQRASPSGRTNNAAKNHGSPSDTRVHSTKGQAGQRVSPLRPTRHSKILDAPSVARTLLSAQSLRLQYGFAQARTWPLRDDDPMVSVPGGSSVAMGDCFAVRCPNQLPPKCSGRLLPAGTGRPAARRSRSRAQRLRKSRQARA